MRNSFYLFLAGLVILFGFIGLTLSGSHNDPIRSSVMITSLDGRSGGSGTILSSRDGKSKILTNSHVCRLAEHGAIVVAQTGTFLVTSLKHAPNHDLCLITVDTDLKVNTVISSSKPTLFYDHASIVGHPALMPTLTTVGRLSGNKIISVVTGVKKCNGTESGPDLLYCAFLGGIPIVKVYNSVLVSATIMPGSSGSGVFNDDNELIGVAFAGQGGLGYAWTVPYDAVVNFLNQEEHQVATEVGITDASAAVSPSKRNVDEEAIDKIYTSCNNAEVRAKLGDICKLINNDMIWREQ